MILKFNRAPRRSAAYFLAVSLIMVVATLIVLSFARAAFTEGSMQVNRGSLKGQIVGFGDFDNVQTVTLRLGHFPNDTLNIFLNKNTKLQVCNESNPLIWSIGRNATMTYHEVQGVAVADSISEPC